MTAGPFGGGREHRPTSTTSPWGVPTGTGASQAPAQRRACHVPMGRGRSPWRARARRGPAGSLNSRTACGRSGRCPSRCGGTRGHPGAVLRAGAARPAHAGVRGAGQTDARSEARGAGGAGDRGHGRRPGGVDLAHAGGTAAAVSSSPRPRDVCPAGVRAAAVRARAVGTACPARSRPPRAPTSCRPRGRCRTARIESRMCTGTCLP